MRAIFIAAIAVLGLTGGLVHSAVGQARTGERHCVVWVAPALNTGHSRLSAMRCYARFRMAEQAARGPAPSGFAGDPKAGAIAASSTRISIDYDGSGFTGSTLTWTVSDTLGCNDGSSYSAASMPSGWNDRVSSSHSYNGCANNFHYHDTNFLGAGITCTCSSMGTMNNQTSSERWTS